MPTEIDYMEYANDGAAQGAYVSSDTDGLFIDQDISSTVGIVGNFNNDEYRECQSFTLNTTTVITKVAVEFGTNVGAPAGNITCVIETDNAGEPSGALAHANATKTQAAVESAWNVFDYTDFSLAAGLYWIRFYCDNQVNHNYFRPLLKVPSVYPNGNRGVFTDGAWSSSATIDVTFRVYVESLQCFSESSIKQEGSYSLKVLAIATASLNDTLTRTIGAPRDLSGVATIVFNIYALRTGANIKIGIHDSGGTTTEKTHTVVDSNTWESVVWDISGVADVNKDDIDNIIITIINADSYDIFYIDYFYEATEFTLSAATASYSLSGQTILPCWNRFLTIDAGSYTLGGQTMGTLYNRLIAIAAGSYALGGQVMNSLYHRVFPANTGSYTLSGQIVLVCHNRFLTIDAGSYVLTGQDASLGMVFILYLYSKLLDSLSKESVIDNSLSLTSKVTDSIVLTSTRENR